MDNRANAEALTVDVRLAPDHRRRALERDVRRGLARTPKTLSPVWFYDARGSALFDEITRLPEYYLTRAERSILGEHAAAMAAVSGCDTLVELGSGTSEKTRLLLDAMAGAGALRAFVPFDVSEETLRAAAGQIRDTYRVPVHAVVGDFHQHLGAVPREGRRLVAFLGSTIGNLNRRQRRTFLRTLAGTLGADDRFLLGTDLVKDEARLLAAYDDAAGVTAAFNRNMLSVLNAEAGADFEPGQFDHLAVWDPRNRWIEMRLRARRAQRVRLAAFGMQIEFQPGESLHTEISSKFTMEEVEAELGDAGLLVDRVWTDGDKDFAVTLARPR